MMMVEIKTKAKVQKKVFFDHLPRVVFEKSQSGFSVVVEGDGT